MLRIAQSKLSARFPDAFAEFLDIMGSPPSAYLAAPGNSWNLRQAGRLMDLATEYKPLTKGQWARLSEAERAEWRELEELEAKFARLDAMGPAGTCDPEWLEVMLEAGRRIVRRPVPFSSGICATICRSSGIAAAKPSSVCWRASIRPTVRSPNSCA